MDLITHLFYGFPNLWGGGVAHTFLVLSLAIALGLILGKMRVAGVSLGLGWVLFIGILFGFLGFQIDGHILHYMKEFGLVLFVYSIGMQAGPSFFSSFTKGGLPLNLLTLAVILLSVAVALTIHFTVGLPIGTTAGLLSGAVTNTPGLGAAQQAWSYITSVDQPQIAVGFSLAYPMGVVGTILCFILLRFLLRIDQQKEERQAEEGLGHLEEMTVRPFTIEVDNDMIEGKNLREIRAILKRKFVVSRILRKGEGTHEEVVNGRTLLHKGDRVLVISQPKDVEPIRTLLGKGIEFDWNEEDGKLLSRRVLVTQPNINGQTLSQLKLRANLEANVTRINRSGVDLVATPNLKLQLGDKLTVVGTELAINHVEKLMGNQLKRLNNPNLIPIFLGIALGCVLANIPIPLPGMTHAVRLGLTGGPMVVGILIGYFGPKYKLVTYNTISANLMIREVGICLFLASVGIGAGPDFFRTLTTPQALQWVGLGALITVIPILIGGLLGRWLWHLNFYTLLGVLSGAYTNPMAMSFASRSTASDSHAVGYATVYPFAIFMRIISVQIMVMAFAA